MSLGSMSSAHYLQHLSATKDDLHRSIVASNQAATRIASTEMMVQQNLASRDAYWMAQQSQQLHLNDLNFYSTIDRQLHRAPGSRR